MARVLQKTWVFALTLAGVVGRRDVKQNSGEDGDMEGAMASSSFSEVEEISMELEISQANFNTLPKGYKQWERSTVERDVWKEYQAIRNKGYTCPEGKIFRANTRTQVWDCNLFYIARNWSNYFANRDAQIAHNHGGSTYTQRAVEAGYVRNIAGEVITADTWNVVRDAYHPIKRFLLSNSHCIVMGRTTSNRVGVGFSQVGKKKVWVIANGDSGSAVGAPHVERNTDCLR